MIPVAEQKLPCPTAPPKPDALTERRAWIRFPSDQTMTASTTDTGVTGWLGRVRDISLGGIALMLRRRFERGTSLILELATNAGELRRLSVQVVHATWEMDGRWVIGCTFTSPLSEEELQTFVREASPAD